MFAPAQKKIGTNHLQAIATLFVTTQHQGSSFEHLLDHGHECQTAFGKLLQRVADQPRSLVIEKRGVPRAILLSIRDYVTMYGFSRFIGEESKANGTATLRSQQINSIIVSGLRVTRKPSAQMISLRLVVDTNIVVSAGLNRRTLMLRLQL